MSRRRLPTLKDAMIGMSFLRESIKRSQGTGEDMRKKVRHTLDEEGRERNPFAEEGEECFIATHERASARLYLYGEGEEGEWGVCPKGEWWSLGRWDRRRRS